MEEYIFDKNLKKRIRKKKFKQLNDRMIVHFGHNHKKPVFRKYFIKKDPYIGEIKIEYPYCECPVCGTGLASSHLMGLIEDEKIRMVEKLLPAKYPLESNEYLTLEQIEEMEGKMEDENDLHSLNLFCYNSIFNGKRLYLKESYKRMRADEDPLKLID